MDIELISENEIDQALELVLQVFMEFEAPDYSSEGVDSFVNDIIKNDDFRKGCMVTDICWKLALMELLKDQEAVRQIFIIQRKLS